MSLRYLDAGRTVVARIVEADVQAASAMVEVEFVRIESIAALGAADPLTLVDTALTLVGPPPVVPLTLDELNRRLYHVLELIEGLRALVNRAGESLDRPVYAAPPLVRDLSAAGPTTMAVQVAGEVTRLLPLDLVTSVLAAAATIATTHQAWHDAVSPTDPPAMAHRGWLARDGSTSDGSLDDGSPADRRGRDRRTGAAGRPAGRAAAPRAHPRTDGAALEAAILDRVGRTVPGSHLTRPRPHPGRRPRPTTAALARPPGDHRAHDGDRAFGFLTPSSTSGHGAARPPRAVATEDDGPSPAGPRPGSDGSAPVRRPTRRGGPACRSTCSNPARCPRATPPAAGRRAVR